MTDRQLIARIMAIEREQKRRYDGDSLARYNTGDRVHEKQMAFHRCEKRKDRKSVV